MDISILENTSDVISRQDAIDAVLGDKVQITNVIRAIGNERDFEVLNCTCDRHAEIIKALPTVQPTIIRCRDCKYSIDVYNDGDCYCKRPSRELVWIGKSWDFFCKAGDKREGEADGKE